MAKWLTRQTREKLSEQREYVLRQQLGEIQAEAAGIKVASFQVEPGGPIVVFDQTAAPVDEFEVRARSQR